MPLSGIVQATSELTGQQSVLPANARAVLLAYIDSTTGAAILVDESGLPVSGGGGGGGGDATAANQVLQTTQLNAINTNTAESLTNAELRATPVPVSAASLPLPAGASTETTLSAISTRLAGSTSSTVNSFNSLVSLQVVPASAARKALIMHVRAGSGDFYIRAGSGAVSLTDKSVALKAGETAYFSTGELNLEWVGMFATSGTADITVAS